MGGVSAESGMGCLFYGGAPNLLRLNGNLNRNPTKVSSYMYQKFLHFALEQIQLQTHLTPLRLEEKFKGMKALDGKTELQTLSFRAPKIRLLRGLAIDGGPSMQVLDFAAFPDPEFDLPIFCANFFTTVDKNIVILDLNPLHDVIKSKDYKEKYYRGLLSLGQKYAELLPWGDQITSESIQFFSPIVLWTRFPSSQRNHESLYSAFTEYFKAWLQLLAHVNADTDLSRVSVNREAQHKYLTWRSEKDPGQQLLLKLLGKTLAKELLRNFLFYGVDTLGKETFLDYFPEYKCKDGTINKNRSVIGKSFKTRPWNDDGDFVGEILPQYFH